MTKKAYKLDSDEQAIEDSLDEYVTIDNEEEMKKAIVEAAKAHGLRYSASDFLVIDGLLAGKIKT